MNIQTEDTSAQTAETAALRKQAVEAEAELRFDALHATLEPVGRAHEATDSQEFREWMQARAQTDDAWGRWAVAMDATAHN